MQFYSYLHHLPEEAFWATVGFGMAQFYQRFEFSQPGTPRHPSKAHAKYETETKIVLDWLQIKLSMG